MQIQAGLSTSKERSEPHRHHTTFQLEHTELRVLGVLPRHSEPKPWCVVSLAKIYIYSPVKFTIINTEILGAAYKAQSRDFHFGTIFAPAAFLWGSKFLLCGPAPRAVRKSKFSSCVLGGLSQRP